MKEIKSSNYNKLVEAAKKKKMKGEDPCYVNYQMIGTKKDEEGKVVPNCVPKKASTDMNKVAKQTFEEWANQELNEEHHKDSLEDGVLTFNEWVTDELQEPEHGALGQGFSFDDWAREEEEEEASHMGDDEECEECHHHHDDHEHDNEMHEECDECDYDDMEDDWADECEVCHYEMHDGEDMHGGCHECGEHDMMNDWHEDGMQHYMVLADSNKEVKTAKKTPAWQRSEGKNKAGGLNEKGRKSYNRETGGHLKAPVTEKNPTGKRKKRRKSFCARMKGMKKKLTSKETAKDPNSRINKALRKWNC